MNFPIPEFGLPEDWFQIHVENIVHQGKYDFSHPHRHQYNEIMLFRKGSGVHLIDFQDFLVEDYSVHFLSTERVHKLNKGKYIEGQVIVFEDFMIKDQYFLARFPFFRFFNDTPVLKLNASHFETLWNIVNEIKKELDHPKFSSLILQSYLVIFLNKCMQFHQDKFSVPKNTICQLFVESLEKYFKQERTVNFYAQQLHLSLHQLNLQITDGFGKSPKSLIQERLHLEAKRLLCHTLSPVKQISFDLGYYDEPHFVKRFIQMEGLSPMEFRRKFRNE